MMKLKIFLIGILFPAAVFAQKAPSLDALQDGIHHWNLLHPDRTYMPKRITRRLPTI